MRDFDLNSGIVPELDVSELDVSVEGATGGPLRCYRPMLAADLTVPTPVSIFGMFLVALLGLPRDAFLALPRSAMVVPTLLRIRHHRRA